MQCTFLDLPSGGAILQSHSRKSISSVVGLETWSRFRDHLGLDTLSPPLFVVSVLVSDLDTLVSQSQGCKSFGLGRGWSRSWAQMSRSRPWSRGFQVSMQTGVQGWDLMSVKGLENGLRFWVPPPPYYRPWPSQMLQFKRFTDSVHHQQLRTTGIDTTQCGLFLSPFSDCFTSFKEMLKH